jgi:hypothetical protein
MDRKPNSGVSEYSERGVNVDETIRRTGNLERDGAQSGRVSEGVGSIAASDELNTCP